ncbi:TPA: terminase large subunit domain-containing protein [Morganella morganii]
MATVADGIRYAEQVVAGEIVTGELIRLACQRFLDDLERGPERDIFFIEERAQHILDFYQFVPHVKGALAGKPIELMPWHTFILINIFGFVIPLVDELSGEAQYDDDGDPVLVRRFRTAYNEVARKNAKSTLSSGIGLYMTGADGEGGAEVYSAATTRDQARIVFEDAKNMIKKAKGSLGRLFEFNKLAIYQERSASKFEPLSSDANNLDGLNIHCGIVDELHAHKTRDVWDVLETATGARLQSLLFAITTAGFNREGICYELRDYAIKVLRGVVEDDTFFAAIYTPDEDDDPFDESIWIKANPGLGVCRHDFAKLAADLEPFDKAMAGIYMARTGQDEKDICRMMDEETYIGSSDAIDNGFADGLLATDAIDNGDETPQAAVRKIDALLAKTNTPRSERRKLISALTGSMPGAASDPEGTPCAAAEINPQTLSELEEAVRAFTPAR